jgi:TorA maturation chaperone TorD
MAALAAEWTDVLAGEMLLCSLAGRALYAYPDRAWLSSLITEDVFAECPFACDQDDMQKGLAMLRGWAETHRSGLTGEAFDYLCHDYNRLFVGPEAVLAPPWESVHFSADRLVFQKETLDVRAWYARFDLQIVNLNHEPDDHIGLELEFLAHLARLGLDALDAGDAQRFEQLLDAQRQFFVQHPLRWAPKWCYTVTKHALTDFYRGVALIVAGGLSELAAVLQQPS